ncbi:MAG: DUF3857 domain-containing transglutaminase family protein, partial [bacterium]|nr:DUF3857 domain-containing transglutaminase family protein [bacterium]
QSSEGDTRRLNSDQHVTISPWTMAGYYDDQKTFMGAFDHVEVGDIVAFEYNVVYKPDLSSYCHEMVIQGRQPVLIAENSLEVPKGWAVESSGQYIEDVTYERHENKHRWSARHLTYRPNELLMPPPETLRRMVRVCCYDDTDAGEMRFAGWSDIARWAEETLSPGQTDVAFQAFAQEAFGGLDSRRETIDAVGAWVRDEIRYVALEIGDGRYVPREPSATLANRYGDCKDKTTLMRALLAALDVPSCAALASIGSEVNPDMPSLAQFNHAIVAVPLSAAPDAFASAPAATDNWLFFDPTYEGASVGDLPGELHGTYALVAAELDSPLVRLREMTPEQNRRHYAVEARLAEDGSASAGYRVTDFGVRAARSILMGRGVAQGDREDLWRGALDSVAPGAELTEFHFGHDGDSAWVTFDAILPKPIQSVGQLNLLGLDIIASTVPPRLPKGERAHPIWFGEPRETTASVAWSLGDAWTIEDA